ncbi:hypothetical protein HNY73_018841 [Argiope bruennichi]|uniref:Transposase n=1 Tax=Argiope bruennichi TaxID=94029 RepID=A0A8T0EEH7_ARGBR|nr:hypothetical protein HNY73_018841 [Argiope bruennichi]
MMVAAFGDLGSKTVAHDATGAASFKLNFLRRFVTADETWIHHYTPETKQQSKQWAAKDESTPKKAKSASSAGKTVLPSSKTVIVMAKLHELKFEILPRAPYSPDITSSDYNLFSNLKIIPAWKENSVLIPMSFQRRMPT